jgi:signal transduction histidine kinase
LATLIKISKSVTDAFLRVGFALVIAFILSQFQFDYLEALLYDVRVRLKPVTPISGHVELIAVDPLTVERLGHVPNALDHSKLLANIRKAGAAAVIYLISPNEIVGSTEELEKLAREMKQVSQFYVGVQDVALKGEKETLKLLPPFENIIPMSAPKTSDRNIFAGDNVTRRLLLSYQGQTAVYSVVAKQFNPAIADDRNVRGMFEYLESNQAYIDFRPRGTYPRASFISALNGEKQSDLHGKIVIVGRDTQSTEKDYLLTPFSRDVVAMSVLEMTGNIFDTLILNTSPIRSPHWIDLIFTSLIAILTVYIVLAVKPTRGLVMLVSAISGFSVFSFLMFWIEGIWISMASPFLAIFICYYFFIPYRLIIENRRSWEYFQKNRLLTQVEELKTNFLSMMSHDLKTPIARIQGMTDIVMRDSNPLSPRQAEALSTLAKSSQELLEFVSSILNLGRIESKELKLHVKSRDPNSLLQEVIEKLDYMAKSKGIEVNTELEPLFSLKMDVDLIRQVFSNLIENAIKYSPVNSRILVTTEERGDHILIQVADQGAGIPEDELPHVFKKFYRSKDAKSSTIKGSGLGLYLAKYFVELHKGTISVDSRTGEGSTFTVELPTVLAAQDEISLT